jgi:hypothetical protein
MCYEVYCADSQELFDAYMKWMSQVVKGKKTEVIIYNKTEAPGVGKTKSLEFLIQYVIEEKLCVPNCSTEPLLTNNNKILMGKILILFEELPTFNTSQWSSASAKLKTLCTEDRTTYRDLYEKVFEGDNILNICINTNHEALKESSGRRVVILPISRIHQNDYDY